MEKNIQAVGRLVPVRNYSAICSTNGLARMKPVTFENAQILIEPKGCNWVGVVLIDGRVYPACPRRTYGQAYREAVKVAYANGAVKEK